MGLAENFWKDRTENYAYGYAKTLNVTTADNIAGIDISRPVVVYSVTIWPSQANASGDLSLIDTSATADTGTTMFRAIITSAGATTRQGACHMDFPRGIIFDKGCVVSAGTVTGAVTITYRLRNS